MEIRRYTHEDYPKFLDLVHCVYDEQIYEKVIQRFKWQYEQNPNNTAQDPMIFVLEDENKFLGMVGTFPQRIKIGGSVYPGYWIGDYMLRPDARRGFHAINLAKMFSKVPFLVMGFPVEYSIKIWLRLGGIQFSQLVRYTRKAPTSGKKSLSISEHLNTLLNHKFLKGIKIVEITHFDERFDHLWKASSKYYPALQVRDSAFLNWRFSECPHIQYRILAAIKGNEVSGYIVLRAKLHDGIQEGSIVDLFADRSHQHVTALLMEEGIKILEGNGCKDIKITLSSEDNFLINILNQFLFMESEVIDRGLFYNNTPNDINLIIQEPSNWFLSRADSDMDFTE